MMSTVKNSKKHNHSKTQLSNLISQKKIPGCEDAKMSSSKKIIPQIDLQIVGESFNRLAPNYSESPDLIRKGSIGRKLCLKSATSNASSFIVKEPKRKVFDQDIPILKVNDESIHFDEIDKSRDTKKDQFNSMKNSFSLKKILKSKNGRISITSLQKYKSRSRDVSTHDKSKFNKSRQSNLDQSKSASNGMIKFYQPERKLFSRKSSKNVVVPGKKSEPKKHNDRYLENKTPHKNVIHLKPRRHSKLQKEITFNDQIDKGLNVVKHMDTLKTDFHKLSIFPNFH